MSIKLSWENCFVLRQGVIMKTHLVPNLTAILLLQPSKVLSLQACAGAENDL